jgi:hypothetical protein
MVVDNACRYLQFAECFCFPLRFSPSFLIFILTSMPSLWLLEMRRIGQRRSAWHTDVNTTDTDMFDQLILRMGNDELDPSESLPHHVLMKTVESAQTNHRLIICLSDTDVVF